MENMRISTREMTSCILNLIYYCYFRSEASVNSSCMLYDCDHLIFIIKSVYVVFGRMGNRNNQVQDKAAIMNSEMEMNN